MGDPDAPTHKRPRLDSVNPVYSNGHGLPPPQPPSAQSDRHPSHPTLVQASSPPPPRTYPPHALPHPSQAYPPPPPSPYGPSQPSPSLPPSDNRHLPDPRNNISSPGHRSHGLPGTPVTLPQRHVSQDSIASYRTPTPQTTTAPPDQGSRSTSVNISIDVKRTEPTAPQGMEHGGPSPWPTNPDLHAPRHGSMSNGYNATMSPPNEPQFHTPPLPQTPHYGQPPPMAPYSNGPYMAQYGASAQVRRKQVRATQACNHCRSRKQKCDEARPCQFCRENNFECQYKDVPPPKQDRSMMQLQDSVNSISETLKSFVDNFNIWKQHVDSKLAANTSSAFDHASPQQGFGGRVSISEQHTPRLPTPVQGRTQFSRVNSMKMESPVATHPRVPSPGQTSTPIKRESFQGHSTQPATPADSVGTGHTMTAAHRANPNEKLGLKADHKTPAHLLLVEWKHMEKYCNGVEYIEGLKARNIPIEQYPMLLEQDRGLLRVWGVGEGHDLYDGAHGPGSPENYNDSDGSSPASTKEGLWGCPPADHQSPNTVNGDLPRYDHVGGLGPDGKPDFRSNTLWSLFYSYQENIHNLHPFVNPAKLRKMFQEFEDVYSADPRSSALSPAAASGRLNGGVKRKRSGGLYGDAYGVADDIARGNIEHSLRNAIVLLVLALGKVCNFKGKLPHPHSDKALANSALRGYHRDSPRSVYDSFGSETTTTCQRNIDILPGMAYFSYATDILGNQNGGNTVAHAQAMLLAALYLGQFGRVLESWSWTNNACRICLVLVRREGMKVRRTTNAAGQPDAGENGEPMSAEERHRLNLIKCVYWTCLQMESDICAEISELQPSAITGYQSDIQYPSGVMESFNEGSQLPEEAVAQNQNLFIYSSQIHMRVILNDAHNTLYSDRYGFDCTNIDEIADMARSHAELLVAWRKLLPPQLAWNDDDPPSHDINVARMRAKYYGGYYVVLRPLLSKAIHHMKLPPSFSNSMTNDFNRDIVELSNEDQKALQTVEQCVKSAIQSTIAFDRIGARPNEPYVDYQSQRRTRLIVPNIFGTLHAQFGNMLVLTAVYFSELGKFLPDKTCLTMKTLSALYQRTQDILDELSGNSPVLATDYDILDKLARQKNIPYDRSKHAPNHTPHYK
ncbi:hypothetical protein BU23DRAFT_106344 [Bimuria novae-zelandiae CBS 107.79]|uniref:Zn(2)-C6 fungal-type domain-containing protein n=1 Tax=Bimuria novae-zelandiae CBS 107.79 TaxID=1447943 RepID=A0A6A5VT85_9PLEO|nr:hypothetical protein BU23DRAFT_106344 [Bimuria novae-zelandiae CBS 107.79]